MRRTILLLSVVALLLASCSSDTDEGQDAEPTGATQASPTTFPGVEVTGTSDCSMTAEEPVIVLECHEVMSDPRVSGESEVTLKLDEGPEGSYLYRFRGTYVLTNDGGTWEGPWVGLMPLDQSEDLVGVYEGTGDYEGLRYHQYLWHPDPDATWTQAGWIEDTA